MLTPPNTGDDARTDNEAMEVALRHYEGLVLATAARCVAFSEEGFDDVAQVLRVKVWQAVRAWDHTKSTTNRDKYVFMCVRDRAKDVVKKKKHNLLHIEDCRPDDSGGSSAFDAQYLCSSHDDNYGMIEDDDDLLAGLDELERKIVAMLSSDYKQAQVARTLGLAKVDMDRAMRSIRDKLSGLRPPPDPDGAAPGDIAAQRARTTKRAPDHERSGAHSVERLAA